MRLIRPLDSYLLLVATLIALTRRLNSPRLRRSLSHTLGWSAFHLSREKRAGQLDGLKRYFGDRVPRPLREIAAESFRSFWADVFSLAILPGEWEALRRIPVVGEERLAGALKAGKGAILWESNAFGMRNLAKQVLFLRGFRFTQVHVAHHLAGISNDGLCRSWIRKKVVQPFFESCEKRYIEDFVYLPADAASLAFGRRLQAVLEGNRILCSAWDGAIGVKKLPVPLMGSTRELPTGMVSLARAAEAPLLPLFCVPAPESGFQVVIERPVRMSRTGDRDRDLRNALRDFAHLAESQVVRHPGQYRLWRAAGSRGRVFATDGLGSPSNHSFSTEPSRLDS